MGRSVLVDDDGADDYITKPFSTRDLMTKVREILK